jgi:HK97 family phage portal protein
MALLSLLQGKRERRPPIQERRTSLSAGDPWLVELLSRGTQTSAGTWVTPDTALRIAAVYRAVSVIASGIAMTELALYKQIDKRLGKERAYDNPLYRLMHDQPNEFQTSFEFREQMTANCLLNGNGYAEIMRRGDGVITELAPLNPERVRPYRAKDGRIWYEFRPIQGNYRQIAQDEMLHLKAFSRDGITGLSPIALMRESVGLAQASEEYQARFFSNDATPPLVLTTPAVLNEEAQKRLQQSWIEGGAGLPNAHRPRVLEQGLDVKVVGISNRDAEFLALRKYQVTDIARIFGVPPHMIGDLDRATFNNIEQLSLEFVTFCLQPWFWRWQQVLARDLMSTKMQAAYFFEFRAEKLIVADVLQRYQAYNAAIMSGWMNRNEPREREGLNPQPGLDVFVEPLNVQPVGSPAPTPKKQLDTKPAETDDNERMKAAYRDLVTERANRIIAAEVRALRAIASSHSQIAERRKEIEKFYKRFNEAGQDHIRQSRRELREFLEAGEDFEDLLVKWEQERTKEMVEAEMAKWQ